MRAHQKSPNLFVAVDTGGTFTDCVWHERGRLRMLKVFSTPEDPSRAIAAALEKIAPAGGLSLLHGTTVGTNALLERKGARVALITTAGFEDAIEIGRQARPRLYDFFFERTPPLVPPELRFGARERTGPRGEIIEPLASAEIERLAQSVSRAQPQAIAISLLFSFADRRHELRIARRLARMRIPLSLSHRILPEFREYERTSTVVMNAYLQPVVERYLERLRARLAQRSPRIFVMQSSGGIAGLRAAAREPVRTLLSGPAGGVVGAAARARKSGCEKIICFDMGGTSTDVSLVAGAPQVASEGEVAGLPVRVPMLAIHTVGAGGGSLARFDAAGALRVGPESAGASPGPVCYGKGLQPTVTDANLLLGRVPADRFLGGEFALDLARTRRVIARWLKAHGSRMSLVEFAAGVVRVANANMEKALRLVSVERGYDPREFTLVAFGGAGGLHACELAQALGIPRVMIPALPGALSAYGILVSDVVKDYSRTVLERAGGNRLARELVRRLRTQFARFTRQARADFLAEGWSAPRHFIPSADLRYRGQGYELNVSAADLPALPQLFHAEHQRRYGYSRGERELEIVTLRLRARLPSPAGARISRSRSSPALHTDEQLRPGRAAPAHAHAIFAGRKRSVVIYERSALAGGKQYSGPAIICEYSATTVAPPGSRFRVDGAGNLLLDCALLQ